MAQSFGALATIAVASGGVMGLPLLISDYRHKKILKRYHVTPVSPVKILIVHVLKYALYSVASLVLVYITAALFFGYRMSGSLLSFCGAYLLITISIFSVGIMVGGIAKDSKTAGIIASLLFFPMLIFSGSTLPYEVMPAALQRIADIMPLTHGIKLLKAASLGLPVENAAFSLISMIVLAVVCVTLTIRFFKWE
jgi:ABC-2 type transport system permease protein